ncbi:PREDICTED: uncharacterized protein LOC109466241 [Branchiostoma belcheri]|uniref:Uncharacterized protein LOC109466241 n=1 Tax=Branchiostoma belcheri TaxID=7741 RepID=A0A6P4Y4Z2_BRABE|nr:PREDICTED: uncharacterized protein LOC109466241 [Branchiostoma belcheri]
MKDIKTSAAALRALVELGYPLELSRVVDYLKNLESKDELLQFDNEEGLCNFLQKYPTMFWVEGGKVFPAQMKPKGRPSPQTQQSQPKAQGVSNSTDKATQLEQKVNKVETLEGDEKKNRNLDSADIAKLREDSIKAIAAVLKREGPTRLKALLKYAHELPPEVRLFVGKEEESIISFILEQPDVFFIDDNDVVFHVSTVHKEAAQEFKLVLQSRGKLHVDRLTGHISSSKHRHAILWFIGGRSDVEKFLKGYPNVFRVDDSGTVSLINAKSKQPTLASACSGEKATTTDTTTKVAVDSLSNKTSEQLKTSKENKLLEEGVKHFRDVLQVKGSMPIERLFGHVNQCRDEVKRAIGTKENEVETFLHKYPEVFSISRKRNVYLVSSNAKQQQVNPGKDKLLANPKTKQCKESVAIKEEGVKHFKKVLESKGSLHIKSLCGHSGQYKYVDPMLKIIGGGPSSVMDFLKGFPNMFSIGDDGMVHLTSQSQANKPGTENRSYAMVVETGQKVQAKAADSSHLQDNIKGKSASSTAVVGTHDKTAGKAKKESILLEGVQHFKQVLESKGSMPLKNIFGHVNQCRNQVKWAIGSSVDNVKKFLLKYPEVFYVDKKMVVHLACNRAKEQQQEQNKPNNKQLQIEEKALAHFTEMLSRKGPSTTHVLSSCFSSCGEDIRRHVGNSKEGLIKFFRKHPQIFKVDADEIVYLKSTGSMHIQSMVFKPQRWASCDTLTVPCDTVFPKVLSKLSGSTPDVRSAVGGGTLQQEEEVKDKLSQQDRKDKYETGDGTSTCTSMPCPQTQHTPNQKADSSNNFPDKFISAVKDILSKKGSLHVVQLVDKLGTMLPHERFELSGVRLLLKKCPEDFHVNDQDIVEEVPPMNVFAVVNKMLGNNSCFATLEDTSIVYVHIALYRERMGVDCTRLQDHLSTGDILLVDTEHGTPGSSSKWTATNIRAVFKSPKSVDADKNGVNFQTPMPFLPATTIVRSPSEICGAIVKLVASSTLHVKDLSSRMKYLNHDAVLYLREKGGLLSFLQSQPQLFLVQDKCVTLVAGEGELDEGTSQCLASPGARCTIGEVSVISKNIAHLHLPDDKEAILDLTDSITTSHLSVGDCLVAYINIVPSNQSEIPWEVSEVKCVMGIAVPAQVHAKTATATCGSHLLKYVLQQCVLEEEVDTVLAWHRLLSQTTQVTFEEVEECLKGLSQKSKMHTLQQGVPCEFFEKYPTLFHVDRFRKTVSLVECSPMSKTLFVGDVKHVKTLPAQVEGNTQTVTEKPPVLGNSVASAADTDKDAVEFFKSMVLAKGQVSVQVLSTCFDACPTAIRQHVGSSMKGLAKFLRDHPDTFSLDKNDMVCALKDTFKTVKQGREMDQIAQKAVAYFKAILSKKGPLTIHVLSSGFGPCPKNIRMHVGSSKFGLTNFFFYHPEIFTVDKDQVVSLTDKTSAAVDHSLPPSKDGGDKLDSNSLSVGTLVDAQGQHQHSAPTPLAVEEDTDGVNNQKQTSDYAEGVRDQSSLGPALLLEVGELSSNVQEDRNISTVQDASRSSCPQSPNPPVLYSSEEQHLEDQADQEPQQKDQAEIEKETLELIVNLVQKSGQVSLTSLQGHINLLGEEKQDCIKDKGGLLTFLQHHYGTIFNIDPTSESVSLRQKQDVQRTEPDFLTSSSAEGEQLQPKQLTVEEEVENVRSSLEKTSIRVDISDAEDSKKNVPMKEAEDDSRTSFLKPMHPTCTEECDEVDTVVTPSVSFTHETDAVSLPIPTVQTPNPQLEQYLNQEEAVCDSLGLPTATVHPVVPVDNPPGQPDDDFTSLLHMFKDNLSPIQDNLVEVEMDIGRIPIARYYNPASPNLLAPLRLSEETLTRETLETILSALPLDRSATGQGRVLLRGSLHWVSTLKNSSDDVVGLTLRRGQAVPGCLDLLWDMVTSGTSTLIIGRPCSGKTTLLREWARVLSDVCYRRVIVVDTLNEIAGGDDVPHPGVGGARRVQVHNRCQQVSQLQTAARNHSPDCIIVDEVQTLEEVTALQAIRLTGIQVIAGVCAGSLPDLLHNSVMRGLLGMSDPPSSTSASRGVIPQPPTFPQALPVFQAAVQIHNRDNLSVYSDVASFVRMSLLEGRFPLAQHRKRVVTNGRQTEL